MAGFVQRFANNPVFDIASTAIKSLSTLGMRYGDMVVKQSKAIGATEAMAQLDGPVTAELLHTLAMADIFR